MGVVMIKKQDNHLLPQIILPYFYIKINTKRQIYYIFLYFC